MTGTTGFQAGVESNDSLMSYGIEAVWGTAPASQFQAIRYTSESLSGSKNRSRPGEINPTGEASAAVTQSESAAGAINYALSYGTYDDFMSIVLGADWQAPQVIVGVAADIALTNTSATSATLISTTAGKFTNIAAGQWIRLLGFTNAANNGFYRVATKVSALSLVLTSLVSTVTETPTGVLANVRASTLANGTQFKSVSLQQKLATGTMYLRYPGTFFTTWTLSSSVGQFVSGAFTALAQSESSSTTDQSTGAVLAAPSGKVHDSISGIGGVLYNDVAISAVVDTFSLNVTRTGAAAQYGIGSAASQGVTRGTLEVSGSLKVYFRDFTQYALFKSEAAGRISFITKDAAGNAYVITLQSATLMNPNVTVSGPGAAVMGTFTIEGNPQAAGGTIQIDRLPST